MNVWECTAHIILNKTIYNTNEYYLNFLSLLNTINSYFMGTLYVFKYKTILWTIETNMFLCKSSVLPFRVKTFRWNSWQHMHIILYYAFIHNLYFILLVLKWYLRICKWFFRMRIKFKKYMYVSNGYLKYLLENLVSVTLLIPIWDYTNAYTSLQQGICKLYNSSIIFAVSEKTVSMNTWQTPLWSRSETALDPL